MGGWKRVLAIALIWVVAAGGWMILGGVTQHRGGTQSEDGCREGRGPVGDPMSLHASRLQRVKGNRCYQHHRGATPRP